MSTATQPRESASPPLVNDTRLPAALALAGALLTLPVLFYAFVHPLAPVRMATAGAGLIDGSPWWSAVARLPLPRLEGWPLTAALLGFGGFALTVYAGAVLLAWRRRATPAALLCVVGPAVLFTAIGALAMPTQSGDVVDYLLSGRVAAEHGASPYEVAPDAFPTDPLRPFASGDYTTDTEQKPPVWIGAAVGVAALAGDDPAMAVQAFRGVFALVNLVNLWLLLLVLRRWRPDHLLAGLVLYGWSPIITTHAQAKFDVLMATFALLAAVALVHERRYAVVAALWTSVMVKLLTLPLLAVLILGEIRAAHWRRVAVSAALVAGLTIVFYAPFSGGPLLVVDHLLLAEAGGSKLPAAVSSLFALAACAVVLWAGISSRGDTERLLQGWALASLAVLLLVPPGWSWYLITPIAMVSLSGERWKTMGLIGVSGLDFALDTWDRSTSDAFPLPVQEALSRGVLYATVVGTVALAALLLVVLTTLRRGARDSVH